MKLRPVLVLAGIALVTAAAVPFLADDTQAVAAEHGGPADAPLAEHRLELLDLAFEAASALPLNPHVKNRSRAQEGVVEACFALEQPRRGLRYAESIANWRRGVGYADYALHCARLGLADEAQAWIERAAAIASTQEESEENEDAQQWRRDRIRARLAEACQVLGLAGKAARFSAGLDPSEAGRIEASRAAHVTAEELPAELERIRAAVQTGNMDQSRNALTLAVELYDAFFADDERRESVAELFRQNHDKLPRFVVVDLLARMGDKALVHEDTERAREWVRLATETAGGPSDWTLDLYVPVVARLVVLRHGCGDDDAAGRQADELFERYLAERGSITDMFRAEALRPLAEAYVTLGRLDAAGRIYAQALEESVLNPNSRPRAMDLATLCTSMAVTGFEPDAELWERLRAARGMLADPW